MLLGYHYNAEQGVAGAHQARFLNILVLGPKCIRILARFWWYGRIQKIIFSDYENFDKRSQHTNKLEPYQFIQVLDKNCCYKAHTT